ncbi:MAG: radical SAM family heme chaperone HemW [Caldilineaceae bacterium]
MSHLPLGLYIHIPFCAKKCPYCDFNTYAGLDTHIQATVDALCLEMARWRHVVQARPIHTIFLGGGTPTLLASEQLAQLFETVRSTFHLMSNCEITSEANPGTVDRAKFEALHALGVNRLSIGVQSFQAQELQFLGRIHNADDVGQAVDAARTAGFRNINLDFIFGLPNQPLAQWQATLERALALAPEHLSLYSLIVEPNTPLYHWVENGSVPAPDDDLAATHYEYAMRRLAAAGYTHYEISNWARATAEHGEDEGAEDACVRHENNSIVQQPLAPSALQLATPHFACAHNLIYWRNHEYLGIGPGAHSHLRFVENGRKISRRWGNRKPVQGYVKRIRQDKSVEEFHETVEPRSAMGETMMLGLRLLQEGVAFERFAALHGVAMADVFPHELAQLQAQKLLVCDETRARLTPQGVMLGNQVFARFV